MLKVDARELHSLQSALNDADRAIRRGIDAEARKWAPTLVRAAQRHATGEVEKRIAQSATTGAAGKGFHVTFGASGKVGKTGALREITRQYEFGTDTQDTHYKTYLSRHRISKRAMRVTRRTRKQLPRHNPTGRFLYPAVADTAPDLVGRYVRLLSNTVRDA